MTEGLHHLAAPDRLYRLGRAPDPWAWPDWSHSLPDGTFGNRYDDADGRYRVLYASSQRLGTFIETLARFRPDPAVVAGLSAIDGDEDTLPAGVIEPAWLRRRRMGIARAAGRFVDISHSHSLSHLHHQLPQLVGSTVSESWMLPPCASPSRGPSRSGCRATSMTRRTPTGGAASRASATPPGWVTSS